MFGPFFSFQTLWRWIAATTAKWEKDYIDRKKDQNQSGSGSFSAVPEEPGNFLVSLPRWLEAQPTVAVGSSWISGGGGGGGWRLGYWTGWEGRELVSGWGSLNVSSIHMNHHNVEFLLFIILCKQSPNPSSYSQLLIGRFDHSYWRKEYNFV